MRAFIFALFLLVALGSPAAAQPARADGCAFVLGFATLASLIPQHVGQCLDDEGHNPANGDALQHATGGLLVWRKADNWTAFTDGFHTWINGPSGLAERLNTQRFSWEANPDGLPIVRATTVPAPAPASPALAAAGLLGTHTGWLWGIAFSPDGHLLASGSRDGTVEVWDVASRRKLYTLREPASLTVGVAIDFSPDGRLLASSSPDGTVRAWDVATGDAVATFGGQSRYEQAVKFSPDGRLLASWDDAGVLHLLDVNSGAIVRTIGPSVARFDDNVAAFAFAPNGRLAAAWIDQTIHILDLAADREVGSFPVTQSFAWGPLQFSPDSSTLAVAASANTAKLWDVASGREIGALTSSGSVSTIAFSPDGRYLVAGGTQAGADTPGGVLTLWDVRSEQVVRTLATPNQIFSVAYSPAGHLIGSGSQEGAVRLWTAP